ncbi:ATP-binding protein [Asticcacaulis sp. BYS171W]|uniref:ATP-binding protein n=1 Tax=Asticcacaulis aquaticus TaxID=2984212 RepID=A0ABT5HXW5_9CAUL|nr:ATP-binding protein [Asticcacaulis aquaticus]MDC7684916.1 ATP-binding protein [Asticcacaulis aquaticus]
MNEHSIARSLTLRIARDLVPGSPAALKLMSWAETHADWLLGATKPPKVKTGKSAKLKPDTAQKDECTRMLKRLESAESPDAPRPRVLDLTDELGRLLNLEAFDAHLLTLMIACDRLPRVADMLDGVVEHIRDFPALLGELAGAEPLDAARRVRGSEVMKLGVVGFGRRRFDDPIDIQWPLCRVLDREPEAEALAEALAGRRQTSTLNMADFAHVADADFLVRLLQGAVRERAHGVNILIHGPPGSGKTELARTLAAAAGCALHGIGEADDDGEEPNRRDRVLALMLAQRMLGDRSGAVLLFDEMEDLIGGTQRTTGDWFTQREGSKVFVNRLLETNAAPVIWVTNAVGNIDDAILRRMSFILKLDLAPRRAAHGILTRVAADEGVQPGEAMTHLIDRAPETASVLRVAVRAGRLAGEDDGGAQAATSLVRALRGGEIPSHGFDAIDLSLYEADRPLEPLFDSIRTLGALDVSLLLTGPPGTGKTALAHHLARALDKPLLVRRASDLLSKWVGETEQNIAGAFEDARRQDSVLLFDEADSLLFDRTRARTSWEVGQVNEMLTWLDRHPLPVVAATNHKDQLDPASLRRFVFKLDLAPLGPEKLERAFVRFFGMAAPAGLFGLRNLTPGDFAVVARQLRHAPAPDAQAILARLTDESRVKPDTGVRIGF